MSSLTVLSVAYPFAPVGPDAVGGAEQILTRVDEALANAGHRSLVIACQGSEAAGTLIPVPVPSATITDAVRAEVHHRVSLAIEDTLAHHSVDLIHVHGIDFDSYLPRAGVPVLATLHLPPAWYAPAVWSMQRPDTWLHCVSESQQRACPPCSMLLGVIPNGVPAPSLDSPARKGGYALALGRICPEKNLHVALEAGRLADVPVLLGGVVFPYEEHVRYMEEQIVPRLDHERRYVGPVGGRDKPRLLAEARCLLLPTLAPETSSLVAMEALAAGTPVIAFPSGALPDIVEHGVTGFLVDDTESMAEAIRHAAAIDPEACRRAARERFSLERMIAGYFHIYDRIAHAKESHAAA